MIRILCTLIAALVPAATAAASALDEACVQDQADRERFHAAGTDAGWAEVDARDRQRQEVVLGAFLNSQLRTADDYHCAALVLSHSGAEDRMQLGLAIAIEGKTRFSDDLRLRRDHARLWDRLLLQRGQPQWYATQFVQSGHGPFHLYPVADVGLSLAERAKAGGNDDEQVASALSDMNGDLERVRVMGLRPTSGAASDAMSAGPMLRAARSQIVDLLKQDASLAQWLLEAWGGIALQRQDDGTQSGVAVMFLRQPMALEDQAQSPDRPFPPWRGANHLDVATGVSYALSGYEDGQQTMTVGIDDQLIAQPTVQIKPSRQWRLRFHVAEGSPTWSLVSAQRIN